MPANLIKNPFEISFTGNPMPFLFNISATENLDNSTLIVRVFIENSFGSNMFDEIYLQKLYPHQNGNVQLDVASILHPYLDYFMPSLKLSKPVAATGQRKRYKVSYILQTGSNFSPVQESPVLFAAKGGLSYESWHYKEFFTDIIAQQKKPLLFSASREMVQMDETKFFYWMCPQTLTNDQEVVYKIYFDDATSIELIHPVKIAAQKWGIYCTPAGFNQAKLDLQVDPEKTPVKYSISVRSGGSSGTGDEGLLSTIIITSGGGSYIDGTYLDVPITTASGIGSGATANVTISSGEISAVEVVIPGKDYVVNDLLFILNGPLGGSGNGSTFKVGAVTDDPVVDATIAVVAEYFFNIDHRNFYDPYDIIYRNSLGGLESLRLLGRMEIAAEYRREEASRTVPPSYYSPNLLAQTTDMAVEEEGFSGSTQFLSREQCMKLRDLFLNKGAWQIVNPQSSIVNFLPIVLQNNKTKFYSNKDSLLSVQVEFKNAFTNTFFTPGTLMPQARTCPAVERFTVSQLNKNTLQINYSLEIPYEQIEIEITSGGIIYLHNYSGNTGSIKQSFVNPVTDDPVDITIRARTICSRETTPENYGPYATITLEVVGNSLPVAVDDTIHVPSGQVAPYTHPVSLLANDYDPDGDEIEIMSGTFTILMPPGSGTSTVTYNIDENGMVTFLTKFFNSPTASFTYQIREVGGTAWVTGTARITVGAAGAIYVRAAQRNVTERTVGGEVIRDGEVWLEYYSDPAGTVPVDVTSASLVIPAKDVKYRKQDGGAISVVSTNTQNIAATGTKNKIYTGNLYTYSSVVAILTVYHEFTVLPGTGYTPI